MAPALRLQGGGAVVAGSGVGLAVVGEPGGAGVADAATGQAEEQRDQGGAEGHAGDLADVDGPEVERLSAECADGRGGGRGDHAFGEVTPVGEGEQGVSFRWVAAGRVPAAVSWCGGRTARRCSARQAVTTRIRPPNAGIPFVQVRSL